MRHQPLKRIRNTSPAIGAVARELRRDMTAEEKILWEAIRNHRLSCLKFRPQHPVGRFVLDFYCAEIRLVVEVDGSSHSGRGEHDQARTEALATHGYAVIRFSNDEIVSHLPSVLLRIQRTAEQLRNSPSPSIGRGA